MPALRWGRNTLNNLNTARYARNAVLASSLLASVWLTGCGATRPKPADLGPNVPVLGVRQAWVNRVPAIDDMLLDVQVQGHSVLLAAANGEVASIDARTGGDEWRIALKTPLAVGIGSDGRWAAVVSQSNQLIALDGGHEIWRQSLGAQAYTAPLVAGRRVFVLAADRSVSAFDAATGAKLWQQTRPGEPLVLRQSGVLRAFGDTLVLGQGGRLLGLNPDNGSVRWEAPLASPRGTNDVERLVEMVGRTTRQGDSLCARAYQATVGCIDAARGSAVWTQPSRGSEGIDGDEQAIYGTQSNGTLQAWSRSDGARLWSSERLQFRKLTAPLVLGRSVVVGDDSGLVHLLAREDATPLNRLSTDGSAIVAAPVAAADTLVVVTRKGGVYGFRPE